MCKSQTEVRVGRGIKPNN